VKLCLWWNPDIRRLGLSVSERRDVTVLFECRRFDGDAVVRKHGVAERRVIIQRQRT